MLLTFKNGKTLDVLSFQTATDYVEFLIVDHKYEDVIPLFDDVDGSVTMTIGNSVFTDYTLRKYTTESTFNSIDGEECSRITIRMFQRSISESLNDVNKKVLDAESKIVAIEDELNMNIDTSKMTVDEYKDYKVKQTKLLLASYLEAHPLESACHGGKLATYSITQEKQNLLVSNYISYQVKKQVSPDATLTWNATGEECEIWTEEEYLTLIVQIEAFVKPRVSLQQSYETKIMACTDKVEIDTIAINYDSIEA